MNMWFGYPQHEDAHPERPWWCIERKGLLPWTARRTDGLVCSLHKFLKFSSQDYARYSGGRAAEHRVTIAALLASIDDEHPLPAPPPLVGQVWRWPDETERVIDRRVLASGLPLHLFSTGGGANPWPPCDAVLVHGPLSPWAPAGYEVTP